MTLVDQFEPGDPRATSGGETRLIRCGHGADADYTALGAARPQPVARARGRVRRRAPDRVRPGLVRAPRGRLGGAVRARRCARRTSRSSGSASEDGARGCSRASAATTSRSCCYEPEAGVLRAQRAVQALAAQAVGARGAARARPARPRRARGRQRRRRRAARGRRGRVGVRRVAGGAVPDHVALRTHAPGAVLPRRRRRRGRARPGAGFVDYDGAVYGTRRPRRPRRQGARPTSRGRRSDPTTPLPPVDPPTGEATARLLLAARFPALADAPLRGSKTLPLRALARLALHRRAASRAPGASGCSAAAPATASSTARRSPSGWPPRCAGTGPAARALRARRARGRAVDAHLGLGTAGASR